MQTCKICEGKFKAPFSVKEMMLGKHKTFLYSQCTNCETIQRLETPEAIESYYPDYYYSFVQEVPPLKAPSLKKRIIRVLKRYKGSIHGVFRQLYFTGTGLQDKILDIGCGKGKLICEMYNSGFTNVGGVDKFIPQEYNYNGLIKVEKKELSELEKNSYQLLMMHHVFEHMEDPHGELRLCHELLKKNGYLMIRIPVVGKPFEIYGEDWVQLDAPRHSFLHTERSMNMLADQTGFKLERVIYDSFDFQFWGSELYKKNIGLVDATQRYVHPSEFFTEQELAGFQSASEKLNMEKKGDQAIFYLKKI